MPQQERPSQAESRQAGELLGSGRSGARERRSSSGSRRAGRRNPLQLKTDHPDGRLLSALADGLHLSCRTIMGMKRADDEHTCWAGRTVYHYLPQLPDDARRDLTRALFTS